MWISIPLVLFICDRLYTCWVRNRNTVTLVGHSYYEECNVLEVQMKCSNGLFSCRPGQVYNFILYNKYITIHPKCLPTFVLICLYTTQQPCPSAYTPNDFKYLIALFTIYYMGTVQKLFLMKGYVH